MATALQETQQAPHDPTPGEEYNAPEENFARGIIHADIPELDPRRSGKVRDIWKTEVCEENRGIFVTTDRQSAFDRVIGTVPGKGQILNLLSGWWYDKVEQQGIIQTHRVFIPHPNVLVARPVTVSPVEVIVRGYMARSKSSTSVYSKYNEGRRDIYGIKFREGLRANEKLDELVITPTTKEDRPGKHDEELTDGEARTIVEAKLGNGSYWDQAKEAALKIFALGMEECAKRGIILVDTKYEFGVDERGELLLIDEVHTPDSSRYWYADTYQELFKKDEDPVAFDKEMLRNWLAARGVQKGDPTPVLDQNLVNTMAQNYTAVTELLMGEKLPPLESNPAKIRAAVLRYIEVTERAG
jgi:phosphoribosylaminoimidazole-succinocarboxamide synthase